MAGRCGLRVISVTDHDTVAGLAEAREAAQTAGLRVVPGIEITAIDRGRDVHVLGYFFDPADAALERFLQTQRGERIARVREIGHRLESLGCAVNVEDIIDRACRDGGRSVGRPLIADALIAAGRAVDRKDAFDRLLGADRPAFVPRCGPSVAAVIQIVAAAGGIASLAHPGLLRIDDRIPAFVDAGLSAIEARHRDHDAAAEAHYRRIARDLQLAVTGGSDFHGDAASDLGTVTLPAEDLAALEERWNAAASAMPLSIDPPA
jgi:3',5'-nucleoside bisphosphate phosphatase